MFNKVLDTKKKRIVFMTCMFFILLGFSFFYYFLYNTYNIAIPCFFHKITGFYCPGCGITRAVFSLMNLNIIDAVKYNFLIVLVFPFLFYYFSIKILNWIKFSHCDNIIFSSKTWEILLVITLLFGVIRNIKFFSFLAP